MKILMVTMGLNIEDEKIRIVELSKQLKSLGHDIIIVSDGDKHLEEIEQAGVGHYNVPLHSCGIQDVLRARSVLRKVIKKEKTDIVHAHAHISAFLCGALHKRMGFPFVTTAYRAVDTPRVRPSLTCWGQRTIAYSDDVKACLIREYGVPAEQIVMFSKGNDDSASKMAQTCLDVYEQVRKNKYHVVLGGYYGFDNAGDEAILEAISHSLQVEGHGDSVELTVLTNDPEATSRTHGVKAVHRVKILSVLKAIKKCDVLLFGGGSLLQDRTSTRSILYYLAIIHCAKLLRKPVMLYANGIGPVEKRKNRRRVKRAVDRADIVTLRDRDSVKELESMGVKNENIYVTADPVFRLVPPSETHSIKLLEAVGLKPDTRFVVVAVREWQNTERFYKEFAAVCDHVYRNYNMEVLFILMQPQKDLQATQRVREAMKEPSYILDTPCSHKELMGVLGQAKLCLAMRLHTLIFAARMAVPSLGLVYDPKVDSYLKELDMTSAGDVTAFDKKVAIEKVDKLMAEYDTYLERLKQKTEELSTAAQKNEQLLFELLRRDN